MLFNSVEFFIFFIIVYIAYLFLNQRWQNRLLLLASYYFYGSWDWRFLSLLWVSTVIDFFCGRAIQATSRKSQRRTYLTLSIATNLGILGFFKYFNFFAANLQTLFSAWGVTVHTGTLHIILPVGISFYTFQTMSYTIDIYRGKLKATNKFLDFALFVAFFPQLIAGPIERARHLLPQILSPRRVTAEKFYEGGYLIFWGLFQKVFVADNLARFVDPVFDWQGSFTPAQVLVALYAFSIQIFCDFAGYSNIARGIGKCLGFDIMVNFRLPYFAKNPSEFWKCWHISLSSWLKDYLYIPLGGNRRGTWQTYRNLFLTMLLGGLWHGASWKFVVWGMYQGGLLISHRLLKPVLARFDFKKSSLRYKLWLLVRIFSFYHLTCVGWLIFRAQTLHQAWGMLQDLLFGFGLSAFPQTLLRLRVIFPYFAVLVFVQGYQYLCDDLMVFYKKNNMTRMLFYFVMSISIIIFGETGAKEFIYFQF
jgi:alginate O-acetyltransferase complex protein AlgI